MRRLKNYIANFTVNNIEVVTPWICMKKWVQICILHLSHTCLWFPVHG